MEVSQILAISKSIQQTVHEISSDEHELKQSSYPPDTIQSIIPISVVKDTRGYIEKVVEQINGCFESGWFDCCAVMIRRLLETLIIETFEYKQLTQEIMDSKGNYLMLGDLISQMMKHGEWGIGRQTRKDLPKLKDIGNTSAHARRYNARKEDIEPLRQSIRVIVEDLMYLSSLKK